MDLGPSSHENNTGPDLRDKIAASSSERASKTYSRDTLLKLRDSRLVGNTSVLEGELHRYLSPHYSWSENTKSRAEEVHDGIGIRKDDGWRTVNPKQRPNGAANSPPNFGAHSWLVDDSSVSASPDRSLIVGSAPHRAPLAGWRRQNDMRNEHSEEPRRQASGRGAGRPDHGERQQAPSGGLEDAWRPAPPGLGRNMRQAPPGLSASDLPWGAGRGRLVDGERRISGKPRDPPGVLPPHEHVRDPQLPEGWNRVRDRSQAADWRTGKETSGAMAPRHSDPPAWLTAGDTEDFESLSQSADSRRMEFEAEHNMLRSQREAAQAKHAMDEIGIDEIEAMKQQSLAEELAIQRGSRPSSRPTSRPVSRPHSIIGFDTEGAGGDVLSQPGFGQQGFQQAQEQPGSRFSRFFQLDPSASTSNLPNMMQDPALVPQQAPAKQPSQPLPGAFGGQGPQDVNQLQAFLTSRPASAAGSVGSELSAPQRNLIAQLQARNSGNFSQSLQQGQQPSSAQMSKDQMNRYLMEKNLMSPRGSTSGAPGGGLPRSGGQPGGQVGGQGQQFQGPVGSQFNQGGSNNLLSLLQSQQLRTQESNVSQLSASSEPTFANPNPTQQQQQNLLQVLSMGDQQQQGGAGLSNNLIEQLQRMKLANEQQKQQQQMQQHFQQQGQGQNPNLLAAFSAHMPRESGTPKQLPEDLFSFNPNHQLGRLPQPSLQQPTSLGLGKNDRIPPAGGQGGNALAHLLQAQQAQARGGLGQQPQASLPNGLYNLQQQQGNVQNSLSQLAQLRGLQAAQKPPQNQIGGFPQPNQLSQAGLMGQATQPLGGADPQQIARYLEQQRQAQQAQVLQQVAHQQQQARLINTQRLYAMQLQQQQQQQRAAQALLLQQQQLQQQLAALPQNRLSNEALLRQQQLLQLQNLQQMSNNNNSNIQGVGGNILNTAAGDPNALARLFANSGSTNSMPGRPN